MGFKVTFTFLKDLCNTQKFTCIKQQLVINKTSAISYLYQALIFT